MNHNGFARRLLTATLLVAVCLAGLLFTPAQVPSAQAAPSADPDEEIVYIDGDGVIRVLDTKGSPLVQWYSCTMVGNECQRVDGFEAFALVDVNNDGEYEIAGVRQEGSSGRLYVYDPVIASGPIDSNQRIPAGTGIPWDLLYTQQIPGKPFIVDGGNYDLNVPGEEILFGYQRTDGIFVITVIKGTSLTPDGRSWTPHIPGKEFDHPWDQVDSGNINGKGADDVVLTDSESETARVAYHEIDNDMAEIDDNGSRNTPWQSARLGQVRAGGNHEVILTRSTTELASLLIFRYNADNGTVSEQESGDLFVFAPSPFHAFPADITGNGDDEVFALRRHPDSDGKRLIMRNVWGDDRNNTVAIELPLDADNGYRTGAGGDVDGDGKDEVVLMRDNNIRVYTRPDESVGNDTVNNYGLNTNRTSLKIGDLDRLGSVQGPQFGANVSRVEDAIPTGTQSPPIAVELTNISTSDAIPFNVRLPIPGWVSVSPSVGQTRAIIEITFDATGLDPGRYETTLLIDSSNPAVINKPFPLELALTVEPAALIPSPSGAVFYFVKPIDPQANYTGTVTFEVGGTAGLRYTAAVLEVPAGVSAQQLAASAKASLTAQGELVVSDAQGDTTVLPAQGVAGAAVDADGDWPIIPSWVISAQSSSAVSGTATVPDSLVVTIDGGAIPGDALLTEAVVVLVPDVSAGSPVDSVTILPIAVLRPSARVFLPIIRAHTP